MVNYFVLCTQIFLLNTFVVYTVHVYVATLYYQSLIAGQEPEFFPKIK